MKIARLLGLGAVLVLSTGLASAHDYTVGSLKIDHPWSRATPTGAPVAGGFAAITNSGATADRLLAASGDVSDKVEIHEMAVIDGVMKMRPLDKGIEIPAGGKLELKPGSYHVMFIGLKKPLVKGDVIKGSLTFEKAGKVAVEFNVEEMGAKAAPGAMPHQGH